MLKKIVVLSSALAFAGAVAWSSPVQAQQNDHYAGYQIKHKLAKGQAGTILNQVEAGSYTKCKAKFLLVPTIKNGSAPPVNPNDHYLCHQCKGSKLPVSYTVTDQFVSGTVTTKKLKLICNLAVKS